MVDSKKTEFLAKILILGESRVGKTSVLTRYTDNSFSEHLVTTLGIDYKTKKLNVEGTDIKLQIWDTAGQERYKAITQNFYKGSLGMVLVFDLNDPASFATIRNWLENIKTHADDGIIKMLLGNKCDMTQTVKEQELKTLIKEANIKYFETSAKSGKNIEDAFYYMAREIKNTFWRRFTETGSIFGQESKKLYEPEPKPIVEDKKDCC